MTLLNVNPKNFRIALRAYEPNLLDNACSQIIETVTSNGTQVSGPVFLPTKRRIYCVLRSPHVNKDAREHFEIRTHKRLLDIYAPTEKTIDSLRCLDLAAGVDVEIKTL